MYNVNGVMWKETKKLGPTELLIAHKINHYRKYGKRIHWYTPYSRLTRKQQIMKAYEEYKLWGGNYVYTVKIKGINC